MNRQHRNKPTETIMKKKLILYFLVCFTISVSCQKENDFSKTLEEYYALGIPSIDSDWETEELKLTIETLKKLKRIDSFPLPKLKSKKSSLLFKKIVTEIPSLKIQDTINYNLQAAIFGSIQETLSDLLFLYGAKEKEQIYYSTESIEIEKRIIEEATNLYLLTLSFSQNKKDALTASGKAKMQGGFFKVIDAAMDVNEPYLKFHKDDKIKLANTVANSLKRLWNKIDENFKLKLKNSIKNTIQRCEYMDTRRIYSDLLQELEP